jgi:hypothetical protein
VCPILKALVQHFGLQRTISSSLHPNFPSNRHVARKNIMFWKAETIKKDLFFDIIRSLKSPVYKYNIYRPKKLERVYVSPVDSQPFRRPSLIFYE